MRWTRAHSMRFDNCIMFRWEIFAAHVIFFIYPKYSIESWLKYTIHLRTTHQEVYMPSFWVKSVCVFAYMIYARCTRFSTARHNQHSGRGVLKENSNHVDVRFAMFFFTTIDDARRELVFWVAGSLAIFNEKTSVGCERHISASLIGNFH